MDLVLLHKKDIILNKSKLKSILDRKDMRYIDLFNNIKNKYGIDIEYKGFMNLLDNRSSWKFLYAYAMLDILNIETEEIFELVDVNIEKKIKEKKVWMKKYGGRREERTDS